jgi:endonuclease G
MRRLPFLSLLLCASLTAHAGGHRAGDPRPATPRAKAAKTDLPPTQISTEGKLLRLDYEGFTVWLDCQEHGPVKFRYNAQRDSGNAARAADFKLDPYVPKECQQTSTKGYGHGYDRGHQVPANHLDASPTAIKQSNFMTNILPQVAQMNRGAWLATEEIVECYRDIDELLVLGGFSFKSLYESSQI